MTFTIGVTFMTFTTGVTFTTGMPFTTGNDYNPIALRKAKIVCNFGLSECIRVKDFNKVFNQGIVKTSSTGTHKKKCDIFFFCPSNLGTLLVSFELQRRKN